MEIFERWQNYEIMKNVREMGVEKSRGRGRSKKKRVDVI